MTEIKYHPTMPIKVLIADWGLEEEIPPKRLAKLGIT